MQPYAPDHIIVKHKSGQAITQSAQATHGVQLQRKINASLNLHLYKISDGSSVEDKVAQLNKLNGACRARVGIGRESGAAHHVKLVCAPWCCGAMFYFYV